MESSDTFLPNLFIAKQKNIFPNAQPSGRAAATSDASSIVSSPDGNGESLDVNKRTLGLVHPSVIPKATVNKLAVLEWNENIFHHIFYLIDLTYQQTRSNIDIQHSVYPQ